MGNVTSRLDESGILYLRDQTRLSIAALSITSSQPRSSINVTPNSFPATRVFASRSLGDRTPIEFVQRSTPGTSSQLTEQDPHAQPSTGPAFLLKLPNDDELTFTFTFVIRQTPVAASSATSGPGAASAVGSSTAASGTTPHTTTDALASSATGTSTQIHSLTFVYASNEHEVETLVTREFQADPNLHKNANVELVGDFTTGDSPSVTFDWSWKWKPPKPTEDSGGGWRASCSFLEYDQRAHKLRILAGFSFFVTNTSDYLSHPSSPAPPLFLSAPPKIRVASAQSVDSRISSANEVPGDEAPVSPQIGTLDPGHTITTVSPQTAQAVAAYQQPGSVNLSYPRPGDDVSVADDGPLFRATIKALEQKTGTMRMQMKKVIKKAEHAHATLIDANEATAAFIDALKEASSTNANAVQPAIDHYFDKIAREILSYERQNTINLQRTVVEPITKLYTWDIKQAEAKRRDFEEESKDYYAYVGRYLGQRHDSVKAKKLAESDTKYQAKRRLFELKRFDYSSFMQDLSGGRKEQEVLSHLTRYADNQAKSFLKTAQKVEESLPQLEALSNEVQMADKEYQYQRREREEKRRLLEIHNSALAGAYAESDASSSAPINNGYSASTNPSTSDSEIGRADSTGSQLRTGAAVGTTAAVGDASSRSSGIIPRSPGNLGSTALAVGSPQQSSKFKGFRDLEERNPAQAASMEKNGNQRKEGLLWALNRPGSHVDPRAALNKQGWHKFWIVLDQGKLSEYSNWKQKLDLHMDPIDLRMASVREARNAERRFCFEVITPQFKRVYQATSEEDMNNWINSINNALQRAVEGRSQERPTSEMLSDATSSHFPGRDFGSMLTGKSTSLSHGHRGRDGGLGLGVVGGAMAQAISSSSTGIPTRRTTVGGRPGSQRAVSSTYEENPDKLLQMLRDNDQGNCWCADCGSGSRVEWVSINLAIVLCIECSGIHRSLGTHISKVRSLTLDITSFTPDIIELLLLVGNRVANMVWEARLDPAAKLGPQANREQRLKFITSKYADRAFVEPISATLSRYPTADETLLAAIKKNEIQEVIYALALKANPNVTDRSRGTHAVFLALAAADPASPSATSLPGTPPADATKKVRFPVAELLLQNGAQIPESMPAIPLGLSAQQYIEAKRGRAAGLSIMSGNAAATDGHGSSLVGAQSISSPSAAAGAMDRLAREKEARLQKRVSAGGRLAKSPIPER